MTTCCPCDQLDHPTHPDIPAGLAALPRQQAGFPEYRRAMLRDIPTYVPLADWRAREGDDLGIMLLEMGAYVFDVLGFYDERIANESYLRTAVLRPSLRKLVGLIGYQPRPALAAAVVLAAIAEGKSPVVLPPGTAFRSDAAPGVPPQVFETEIEHTIHALKNQWTLGEVRDRNVGSDFLLDPATARVSAGQLLLISWTQGEKQEPQAARVQKIGRFEALDGNAYLRVELDPTLTWDTKVQIDSVDVLAPSLRATVSSISTPAGTNPQVIVLDAIYPQLDEKDFVIIQRGRELRAAAVKSLSPGKITLTAANDDPSLPATAVEIDPVLPVGWADDPTRLIVHFQMAPAGRLTRVAKTHLTKNDFPPSGIPIRGLAEPLPESVAPPRELLLLDAMDNAVLAVGGVNVNGQGGGIVKLSGKMPPFQPPLRTPVTVFGNLVHATRGESVFDEVIGSGDAAQAFQSFTLSKNPLTYLNDPATPNGRRSTLEMRVNGIKWREVPSFFGAGPFDEVYIARQNDEQETVVTFGDGTTGARLPTGVDNITASYRFGAGAAKPPAGAIGQVARPVAGLRRVANPVAASGGADADRPQDMRRNAPASALLLGRAVSLLDFECLAREFGGVINVRAEWAWDTASQRAAIMVWFISDGGNAKGVAKDLQAFLRGHADPNTPIDARKALAQPSRLEIEMEIDPRFRPQAVIEQVKQRLSNPETGMLALENITIGSALVRSRIFGAVLAVDGARSVLSMTVDGRAAPFAITVSQGSYRDFREGLVITGTPAQ